MQTELRITDQQTLKVFTNSIRSKIIDLLWGPPQAVKQLATSLEMPVTTLYYHINLLEEHGLIRAVDTKMVSGIPEKQYQATARYYHIDPALLGSTGGMSSTMETVLARALDDTKRDIRQGIERGEIQVEEKGAADSLFLRLSAGRLNNAQAVAFQERLAALIEEFDALSQGEPEPSDSEERTRPYRLLTAFYPTLEMG